MKESLWQKLRRVRLSDLGHFFLMLAALLPSLLLRRRRPHLWLVCERGAEARDNGYWFFRWLRTEHPEVDAVYAISPGGPDEPRLLASGPSIRYGSFRHWIFYLAAEVNISSQKDGKPNAAVCYLLEVVLPLLKTRRVFLQHGVIMNDLPYLHNENARLSLFCCGAEAEYRFIRDTFGYPEKVVRYTGLCRFDALHDVKTDPSLILILPTWRMELERCRGENGRALFLASDYYRCWNAFLRSPVLSHLLEQTGRRAVFCIHRNLSEYADLFRGSTESIDMPHPPDTDPVIRQDRIRTLFWDEADIGELLRSAAILITDYSSVSMDFAYMGKPLLYYQFDRETFFERHLPKGYFDYQRDGFGPVCPDASCLLSALSALLLCGGKPDEHYLLRMRQFFKLHDRSNCERTFLAILDLLQADQ